MRDFCIAADEWAGCHVTIAESRHGEFEEYGVHVRFDDGSLLLHYSDGETADEALEALACRWEKLATELRRLRDQMEEQ
jgi:hypothetical protein